MPSDMIVIVVGAGCAAIGGLATSFVTSAVERRRKLSDAGRVEVAAKQRVAQHEAITQLAGLLTELNHHLAWISRDDGLPAQQGRVEAAQRTIRQLRGYARSEVANLSPEVFEAIIQATDIGISLVESTTSGPDDQVTRYRGRWLEQLDVTAVAMADETRASITAALQRAWAAGGGIGPR